MPHLYSTLEPIGALLGTPAGTEALAYLYPSVEVQTIDYGIIERAPDVAVVPARFAWSDVGTWGELYDVLPKDSHGNVLRGTHLALDTHRSLILGEAGGRPVVVLGVDDLVVIDTPDALLICSRQRTQEVKSLVEWLAGDPRFSHLL